MALMCGISAVNHESGARNPPRRGGQQESRGVGDIVRCSKTKRVFVFEGLQLFGRKKFTHLVEHLRLDKRRGNGIYPDPLGSQFKRQRLGEADQRALGGAIDRDCRFRGERRDGRKKYETTARREAVLLSKTASEQDGAMKVGVEQVVDLGGRGKAQGGGGLLSRSVNEAKKRTVTFSEPENPLWDSIGLGQIKRRNIVGASQPRQDLI